MALEASRVISVDGEELVVIRTSDRLLFKRCRRLWGWMSHLKMGLRLREDIIYFWFGSGVHYALEDFHGRNVYGHPGKALLAYTEAHRRIGKLPAEWEENLDLGLGMLSYYADYWLQSRAPLETFVLNGESQLEVNGYIDLGLLHGGRRVVYGFTLDRMVIDENGLLWIAEYKTAKAFRIYHYDTDEQVTAYCVPEQTEILTRQGWKSRTQLVIGEEVLGYNGQKDILEWTKLEAVHTPGVFPVVTVSGKSFSFECTEEHKWAQLNTANKWPAGKAKFELKPIKAGQQHCRVVLSAPLDSGSLSITPDEAAIIGWILTDGTWGSYNRGDRASISQKKHVQQIQDLLDRFPDSCSRITETDNIKTWHLRMKFFRDLWARAGLDMELNGWESFILSLSLGARKAMCDAAMLGDGNVGSCGQSTFYQKPGIKHDLFRLAFFLTGVFPTRSRVGGKGNSWSVPGANTFNLGTPHKWIKGLKVERNVIEQSVWCPQTSLGTWVMRQGEQIAVTGNCWAASRLYNRDIAGVWYYQFKKAIPQLPRILSTGSISTDPKQQTTAALYRKMLLDIYGTIEMAPVRNVKMLNELTVEETEDQDRFIRRESIERNKAQLDNFEIRVKMEVEDMLNQDLPLYPNQTKDCSWSCPLSTACVALEDGSDYESALSAYAQHPTATNQEVSWRKHLPSPRQVVLPPEAQLYQELIQETRKQSEDQWEPQISPEESFLEELR